MSQKPIYLDYNATTPLDPRVFELMLPYFREDFGNSVSAAHTLGWSAEKAVEKARRQIADFLKASPAEIFFTAGATESNNWVIRGSLEKWKSESHCQDFSNFEIISSPLEHSSVVRTLQWAERNGAKVHWLQVRPTGEIDLENLKSKINSKTKLISLMWVNNEIGSINPMKEISELARAHQVYFHSDGTQALGKVEVDLSETKIDLLSFSAHKIYGPKGVGVLYKRSKDPKVEIEALMHGGGHERGARSGTLNVPAIVGMGAACEILQTEFQTEQKKLKDLQSYFWTELQKNFSDLQLNGPVIGQRVVNNLNVTFKNSIVPSSFVDIAVSRGSACQSGATSVSPVLKALGLSDELANSSLRMSLGRWTSFEDLQKALETLSRFIKPKK